MLSFSYTEDLQLRDTLSAIDRLRNTILTIPMSVKSEVKLQWESTAIRIWASMMLSDYNVPKQYVATIMAHPTKPTEAVNLILNLRSVYDYIHSAWRANPKPVTMSAFETIFSGLYPKRRNHFSAIEQAIKELLEYLAAEEEHPLIQAAIAHIHILTLPDLPDAGLLARAVHYLYLSKYGYDVRGYIYPDRSWLTDKETYERLTRAYVGEPTLNTWLAFMAESMRANLESLATDIQDSQFHVEFPPSFWSLNDRQKEILKSMDAPESTVTTKKVQKRFKTSQITASRDLTRLASLGLLYSHGKGRSIYYTKI